MFAANKKQIIYMSQESKKFRTAAASIDDLLESKRLELAVEFFKHDPSQLRAILIELAMEAARVQKTALVKLYAQHYTMDVFEMKPLLKNCDPGISWNMYWGLSPMEQALYSIDPKNEKTKHERIILLDQLKKEYSDPGTDPVI